jgi:hypothetical protein
MNMDEHRLTDEDLAAAFGYLDRLPHAKDVEPRVRAAIAANPSGPWLNDIPKRLLRDIPRMARSIIGNRAFTLAYAARKIRHPLLMWWVTDPTFPQEIRAAYLDLLLAGGPYARSAEQAWLAIAEALRRSGYSIEPAKPGIVCRPPIRFRNTRPSRKWPSLPPRFH